MRIAPDRAATLRERGLSDNETRAYLTLLEHPALTGQVLTEATGLPRNRLYEALESLADRGLVEVDLADSTRRYRAKSLAHMIDEELREMRARSALLEKDRTYYATAFAPPPPDATSDVPWGSLRVLAGRRAAAREIDRMISTAQTSLLIVASRGGAERALRHLSELPDRELELAIHLPRSALGAGGLERFLDAKTLEKVTWLALPPATFSVLRDGVELLQSTPVPDSHELRQGRDLTTLTENAGFIEDHVAAMRLRTGVTP